MNTTTSSPDVLYIADVAAKLGKSVSAIRARVHRIAVLGRPGDLPVPFKLDGSWAWRRETFDEWLIMQEQSATAIKRNKKGR